MKLGYCHVFEIFMPPSMCDFRYLAETKEWSFNVLYI